MSKCDVLVVGAGIFGISSAYYLKKNHPSEDVLVVDRYGAVGQGNTGRSNAMFRNTFTSRDNRTLADSAIDFYSHVQNDLGVDVGVDMLGYLWLMSDGQVTASEKRLDQMSRDGVELRRYDREELSRLVPQLRLDPGTEEARLVGLDAVEAGVFGPKCGRLAPDRLANYYRDQFLELGGRVLYNAEAKRLILGPSKPLGVDGEPFVWQDARVKGVELSDGRELDAETTVVACGAWNNQVLDPAGIDGHCKAKKRQLFTVSARGNPGLQDLLGTKGFNSSGTIPFIILPKSGVFVKAVPESNEFWLGCEDEVNREFISSPDRDLDSYQAEPSYYQMNVLPVLKEYLPCFADAKPERMWAGLYSYNTLDNMPYIFGREGLLVVGGDSGSGVMKGDSVGRLVEALYGGGEGAEAELYGGTRYRVSKLGFRSRDVEREDWVL